MGIKVKIDGDEITITTPDGGRIVMNLDELPELETAIQGITILHIAATLQTLELTLK